MLKFLQQRALMLELFLLANLSFLAVDIFVAHSMNDFHHSAEWIPFYFSLIVPFPLILELVLNRKRETPITWLGQSVGYSAILVGIAGLFFHLDSTFFETQTIKSLVYTAPFIAPLSYSGLGFLLILNRKVEVSSREWCQWLIFFGLMGFCGNFLLALCDHAQNGFFSASEWIPVFSAALAIGFLLPVLLSRCSVKYLHLCLWIMFAQVIVGLLGFVLHGLAVQKGVSSNFFENVVHTAPIFAPLLFANLALLAAYGLFNLRDHLDEMSQGS